MVYTRYVLYAVRAVLYTKRIIAAVYTVSVLMFFTFFGANVYRLCHIITVRAKKLKT